MKIDSLHKLEEYPDLMIPCEVANVLRCKESMVHRLKGLRKTRIGNGRGKVLYRRKDVEEYINSKVVEEEAIKDADIQKERDREVGVPDLLPWKELQKKRLEYAGGSS